MQSVSVRAPLAGRETLGRVSVHRTHHPPHLRFERPVGHTEEGVQKYRNDGTTAWREIGTIVLDVIYHVVLTWMSLLIPGVWSLA